MEPARVLALEAVEYGRKLAGKKLDVWVDVSSSSLKNSPYLANNSVFKTTFNNTAESLDITNLAHLGMPPTFLNIGVSHLPDSCVDYLVCNQVVEHMPMPHKAFEEAFRIVKPGGVATFATVFMYQIHGDEDYCRLTPLGLKCLMDGVGFKKLKSFAQGPMRKPQGIAIVGVKPG